VVVSGLFVFHMNAAALIIWIKGVPVTVEEVGVGRHSFLQRQESNVTVLDENQITTS